MATVIYPPVMTLLWVVLAVAGVVIVGSVAYVGWRDRARLSSADDRAAGQAAAAAAERYATEGHGAQGSTWVHQNVAGNGGPF